MYLFIYIYKYLQRHNFIFGKKIDRLDSCSDLVIHNAKKIDAILPIFAFPKKMNCK